MKIRAGLAVGALLLASLASGEAGAQRWDPFPRLPGGEHLAVGEGLDSSSYDNLRTCLRRFDSGAGASYYAAIVEVTSPDGSPSPNRSDATAYSDALHDAWRPGGRLDPETHVLMVLSLRNRAIALHPGTRWYAAGFQGDTITRTIDGSSFGDYARTGDYGLALCDLALAIDRRLADLASRGSAAAAPPAGRAGPVDLPGPRTEPAPTPVPRRGEADSGLGWLGGCAGLAFLALVAGGLLALVLYFRRRKARDRAVEELGRWKEKIEVAAERVLKIETEHPLYFAATAERWRGESKQLDQEAADAVNHVFLLYSKAFELHNEADGLVQGAGAWEVQPFEQAWQLLRETEVRIETGEAEERRRIFLPLNHEYRGSSANLLDDLGAAYGAAYDKLQRVMEVAEKARSLRQEAGRAAAEALEASNRRGELGLPVEHLKEALDPVLERRLAADAMAATDPVAASRELEEAIPALGELAERARSGNAAVEAVRGPIQTLGQKLRGEVERLRGAGYRLEEPGFDPDLRLDRGVDEARRVEDMLAAGEEAEAADLRQALERGLSDLEQQLEASEAARDGVPVKLDELIAASHELAGRAPAAQETLRALRAEHALEAFRDEADNLKELRELLGRLDEWFAHIREDHREQRYLSAVADLERAESLLAEGTDLVDAVGEIERQLNEARDGARELAFRSKQLLVRLDELAGDPVPGLGAELRRSISDLMTRAAAGLEEVGGPRPQWLELEAALGGVEEELKLTVAKVEEELEAHDAAKRLARELASRHGGLDRQVAAETRDRAHVARAVDEAARQLASWKARLDEADFSGSELLRQGRELESAVEQAHGTFETEMDLVRLAETRSRAAESLLRQVNGRGFGYGVVADCRIGRGHLERIEHAWGRQDWEAVVSSAEDAQESIEAERRRCRDRAQMLEHEARRRLAARREAERRARMRRVRSTGGASTGRVVKSIGSAFGGAVASSRSSFGSRLGRSISAGSSFGRSRSGGSSW
ncbi:MAG: hypothetical protein GY719_14440 [bacterium]|nr:hypothetical protein [bacterium]